MATTNQAAVSLLAKADKAAAKNLKSLLDMKTRSGYSAIPTSKTEQKRAGRAAAALLAAAQAATSRWRPRPTSSVSSAAGPGGTQRQLGELAIARRSDWLVSHPAELAWEADLATRLAGRTNEPERTVPAYDHAEPDHDLQALLRSIDLRTIDLSAHLPRTGIERTTRKALGLSQRRDGADIDLPPLPGRGLDAGPDLGL